MHDPGLFAIGLGITILVAAAVAILIAGILSRRREERLMDELMFEALLERARDEEQGAVPSRAAEGDGRR